MPAANDEGIIIYRDVHKWFGDFHVLRGISFTLASKDLIIKKSFSLKPGGFPKRRSVKDKPAQGKSDRLKSPPKMKGRPVFRETIFSISGLYS